LGLRSGVELLAVQGEGSLAAHHCRRGQRLLHGAATGHGWRWLSHLWRRPGPLLHAADHRTARLDAGAHRVQPRVAQRDAVVLRSEEHTPELQSLMRISYA